MVIFKVDESGDVTADGVLVHSSDRDRKQDIESVDPVEILEQVSRLPVHHCRFIDDPSRHIGPMAPDFHTAFCVGADDRHIATIDVDGEAPAAIMGLYERVLKLEAENRRLRLANRRYWANRERGPVKDAPNPRRVAPTPFGESV